MNLIELLKRVYLSEGFGPEDLDKLTVSELEMMLQAREDGLIGFAEKIVNLRTQYPVEPRLVVTTQGYMRMMGAL